MLSIYRLNAFFYMSNENTVALDVFKFYFCYVIFIPQMIGHTSFYFTSHCAPDKKFCEFSSSIESKHPSKSLQLIVSCSSSNSFFNFLKYQSEVLKHFIDLLWANFCYSLLSFQHVEIKINIKNKKKEFVPSTCTMLLINTIRNYLSLPFFTISEQKTNAGWVGSFSSYDIEFWVDLMIGLQEKILIVRIASCISEFCNQWGYLSVDVHVFVCTYAIAVNLKLFRWGIPRPKAKSDKMEFLL